MSDIVGELARMRDACEKPTLALLRSPKWGPVILAVFRSTFTADQRSVPAERFHTQLDTYLNELRDNGEDITATHTGRSLALSWLGDRWLQRTVADGGEEEYALTSSALTGLDLANSLARDRALVSQSRLHTILDTVRRWATEANPDRQERIDRLTTQIEQLERARHRRRPRILD